MSSVLGILLTLCLNYAADFLGEEGAVAVHGIHKADCVSLRVQVIVPMYTQNVVSCLYAYDAKATLQHIAGAANL